MESVRSEYLMIDMGVCFARSVGIDCDIREDVIVSRDEEYISYLSRGKVLLKLMEILGERFEIRVIIYYRGQVEEVMNTVQVLIRECPKVRNWIDQMIIYDDQSLPEVDGMNVKNTKLMEIPVMMFGKGMGEKSMSILSPYFKEGRRVQHYIVSTSREELDRNWNCVRLVGSYIDAMLELISRKEEVRDDYDDDELYLVFFRYRRGKSFELQVNINWTMDNLVRRVCGKLKCSSLEIRSEGKVISIFREIPIKYLDVNRCLYVIV